MRIAVSGTHSSGKTSLVHACARTLGREYPGQVDVVEEVARDVIAMGFPLNQDASTDSYLQYVRLQLQRERGARAQHVLSDRSLIDLLAYIVVNANPSIPPAFVELLREVVWLETRYFDLYCYLPIEFPMQADGTRPADVQYQRAVDEALRAVLVDYRVPVETVSGALDQRCQQVLRFVQERLASP